MSTVRLVEQSTLFQERPDPYLRVLCVNIFVRDHDRSLQFFVENLGFGLVVDKSYESGDRWVAVAPPDGSTIVALTAPARTIPIPTAPPA